MEDQEVTAFFTAAYVGDVDSLKRSIEEGQIAVDEQSRSKGSTAMHWACFGGQLEVARVLVEAGADVNKRNKEGAVPLFYACERCHSNVISWLILSCHADVNAADKQGRTPLSRVLAAGRMGRSDKWEAVFRWMVEHSDVDLDRFAKLANAAQDDTAADAGGDAAAGTGVDAAERAAAERAVLTTAQRIVEQGLERRRRRSSVPPAAKAADFAAAAAAAAAAHSGGNPVGSPSAGARGSKASPGPAPFQGMSRSGMSKAKGRSVQREQQQQQPVSTPSGMSFFARFFEELTCCGVDTASDGESPCSTYKT